MQNRIAGHATDELELSSRRAFSLVAAAGSFTVAARSLGVSVSTVTRLVARLEASLGTRLLARSTHGVALTETGSTYRAHVDRFLADEHAVREAFALARDEGGGTLRISVPVYIAERIVPRALLQLRAAHPGARFDIHASDDLVDVVGGAYDLVVRTGPLANTNLRVKRITSFSRSLYLASAHFRRRPQMPEELPDYPCLAYGNGPRPVEWGFRRSGRKVRVALRPLVRSNNLALLLALTAQGLGIALLPDWVIADGMGLISVLHDWTQLPREVEPALFAVYPEDRGKARLRNAFVGALKEIVSATRPT